MRPKCLTLKSISSKMSTLTDLKNKLRKTIDDELGRITEEDKKRQSDIVLKKLFSMPEFQTSRRISVFLSTDNEISTKPVVERIFQDNKLCFVPRYSRTVMEMVKLHSMEDWDTLPLTPWKIKQPKLKEIRENAIDSGGLDLIIVPGVAFTKDGKRIGHGGGYYDRYLKDRKENQVVAPVTIALAFREQVVEDIPCNEHDQKIDVILYAD